MHQATAYLPSDRRRALLTGRHLPERATGTVLFVDISGFTPLTEMLAHQFGRSRGAELLTHTLNEVYQALIDQVDQHGGSVIGFAGDAITCWFDAIDDAPAIAARRALSAAVAMQRAIARFAVAEVTPGAIAKLAIKTALASGAVKRLLVGDPSIQVIEALAGAPLERMAAAEHIAERGELVADLETIRLLGEFVTVGIWRRSETGDPMAILGHPETAIHFSEIALLVPDHQGSEETGSPPSQLAPPDDLIRPWLLPTVWASLQRGEERYLAELRPATALFVRFSGLDFEQDKTAAIHLDTYIRWVQQLLNRHEGALIQLTTGDKGSYFYAAFGAPIAHDDDAERAIAAALELRTSAGRFDFIAHIQIGVSAGVMRVGAYGSSKRRTYGVLGDETNVAARLMMQAAPGQILASARVAELAQERYQLEPMGEYRFKGKRDAQPVYAVAGLRSPTLIQLETLYQTPLLGREMELNALASAITRTVSQRGQLVRIEGEAGAGKSHLAATAAHMATEQGFTLLYGACQSSGQQPYGALRDPVAALLSLTELRSTPARTQIKQLRTTLAAIEPRWLVRMPLLGDLFDLPIADNPTTAAFDARLRREALSNFIVSIFAHFAQQHPIFLLLEDIHWLDEADQMALLALARTLDMEPLLLCVVHRPVNHQEDTFFGELAALPDQLHLHLVELSAPAIAALLEARLRDPVEALVVELVYAHTQGNPFYAEEMIDALRERGQIALQEDAWQVARGLIQALHENNCLERVHDRWRLRNGARLDAVTLGIPDTVHGLVLSRLDRLAEETRLTLKVAAVIGRSFETTVLASAHPNRLAQEALQRQIAEMEHRDFARLESPPPLSIYVFKHSITQEAVYQTLLESQRQELHQAVARALEQQTPLPIERLTHHFLQADSAQPDVRARALFYLDAAAGRAKRSYANETALAYYERALAFETRWQWLAGKAEVLHILGQRLQQEATLLALGEVCSEIDACDRAVVAELWADFHEATSQFAYAHADLEQALAIYKHRSDRAAQAHIRTRLGEIALMEGDSDAAEQHYRHALEMLQSTDSAEKLTLSGDSSEESAGQLGFAVSPTPKDEAAVRAQVLLGLGVVMRQRGEYDAAAATLGEALAIYTTQENQPEVATALTRLGGVAFLRRNFGDALDAWNRALSIRQSIGDREGEGSSLLNIAQVHTSMGDYGAALPLLRQALDIQRAVGNRWWENAVWNALGIVALAVGDYPEAQRCISIAFRLCVAVGDEAGAAIMEFNLGQVERECGNYQAALDRLERSRQWAHENDDPEFEAQCLTELALTAQAADLDTIAEQHANDALRLYVALDVKATTTTDLATLALLCLARRQIASALAYTDAMLKIHTQSEPHQIEYPQRDLYIAAMVNLAGGHDEHAALLLQRAYDLVQARAANISDETLRRSYLDNVRINRDVIAAVERAVTPALDSAR